MIDGKVIRHIFASMRPKGLAADERVSVADDYTLELSAPPSDDFDLTLQYYRVCKEKLPIRGSFRFARGHVSLRDFHKNDKRGILDAIVAEIRYLLILLIPFRKPKGWRLLYRHVVLTTAPKFRSRLRTRCS